MGAWGNSLDREKERETRGLHAPSSRLVESLIEARRVDGRMGTMVRVERVERPRMTFKDRIP